MWWITREARLAFRETFAILLGSLSQRLKRYRILLLSVHFTPVPWVGSFACGLYSPPSVHVGNRGGIVGGGRLIFLAVS